MIKWTKGVLDGGFGEWAKEESPNYDSDGECGVVVIRNGWFEVLVHKDR